MKVESIVSKVVPYIVLGVLGYIGVTTTTTALNIRDVKGDIKAVNVAISTLSKDTKKNSSSIASLTDKFHAMAIKVALISKGKDE